MAGMGVGGVRLRASQEGSTEERCGQRGGHRQALSSDLINGRSTALKRRKPGLTEAIIVQGYSLWMGVPFRLNPMKSTVQPRAWP